MMVRVGFLTCIFLWGMMLSGCAVMQKLGLTQSASIFDEGEGMLVKSLDAVFLTANDLPTMEERITFMRPRGEVARRPVVVDGLRVVDGLLHKWDGSQPEEHISVQYWLFSSVGEAGEAADHWRDEISAGTVEVNGRIESIYQPEPNAEHVIGDATWRPANSASLWFVKDNVLVFIGARRPRVNQLPFTRSVARKIEAKINAVLNPL